MCTANTHCQVRLSVEWQRSGATMAKQVIRNLKHFLCGMVSCFPLGNFSGTIPQDMAKLTGFCMKPRTPCWTNKSCIVLQQVRLRDHLLSPLATWRPEMRDNAVVFFFTFQGCYPCDGLHGYNKVPDKHNHWLGTSEISDRRHSFGKVLDYTANHPKYRECC